MIVIFKPQASEQEIEEVRRRLEAEGAMTRVSRAARRAILGVIGDIPHLARMPFHAMPGVEDIKVVDLPYKLVSRDFQPEPLPVEIEPDLGLGAGTFQMIAGPCSVETEDQMHSVASLLKRLGIRMMRGGAYKPRTSPYSFQGIEADGLRLMHKVAAQYDLKIVTEIMDARDLGLFEEYAHVLQVGTRNMMNYRLLKELGRQSRPVLLKRGMSATIQEFLLAAEYVAAGGNQKIVLCERGIRTFDSETRNMLDLSAIPVIQEKSHLPVVVDPSHGTGRASLVQPMALAATAAGADGLLIEIHPKPSEALSDGDQALDLPGFESLCKKVGAIRNVLGGSVPPKP